MVSFDHLAFFTGLLCGQVSSWGALGPAFLPDGIAGLVVDTSEDGRCTAVGAPERDNGNGAVLVYELDYTGRVWNLLVEIPGSIGENFGDSLSLSPDGLLVAVRRHCSDPNTVQVYKIFYSTSTTYHYHPIGSYISCPSNGTEITLGQARSSHPSQSPKYYMLVSCETFDESRGMVQAYVLEENSDISNNTLHWETFLPLLSGASAGDHFGFATDLVETPSLVDPARHSLRIAVSSPYHSSERGMVQIYSADDSNSWTRIGKDLVGEEAERFGSSLAMSTTTTTYVVIGSPGRRLGIDSRPHGIV